MAIEIWFAPASQLKPTLKMDIVHEKSPTFKGWAFFISIFCAATILCK